MDTTDGIHNIPFERLDETDEMKTRKYSPFYYPLSSSETLESRGQAPEGERMQIPFVEGSMRQYEEIMMLCGRYIFTTLGFELLVDSAAAGVLRCRQGERSGTAVVYCPGAGGWFGVVDQANCVRKGIREGSVYSMCEAIRDRHASVVILNPMLLKYLNDDRRSVYERHLSTTLPHVFASYETVHMICFSLGGHAFLEYLSTLLSIPSSLRSIDLLDSVVHDLQQYSREFCHEVIPLCRHWRASSLPLGSRMEGLRVDNGVKCFSSGTLDHEKVFHSCWKRVIKDLLGGKERENDRKQDTCCCS